MSNIERETVPKLEFNASTAVVNTQIQKRNIENTQ